MDADTIEKKTKPFLFTRFERSAGKRSKDHIKSYGAATPSGLGGKLGFYRTFQRLGRTSSYGSLP